MYNLESTLARLKTEDNIREANQQRLAHETHRREQPSTTPTAYAVFLSHLPTGSAPDTGTIASAAFDAISRCPTHGGRECEVAQSYDDCPETAAARMTWALVRGCPPLARPG